MIVLEEPCLILVFPDTAAIGATQGTNHSDCEGIHQFSEDAAQMSLAYRERFRQNRCRTNKIT